MLSARNMLRRTCGTCAKVFAKPNALASHCKHRGHRPATELAESTGASAVPTKKVRNRFSYDTKNRALERMYELEDDPACAWPWMQTCQELGLPKSKWNYLTKWRQRADFIRDCIAGGYKHSRGYRYVPAKYPAEEDELYIRFLNRRIVKGYPCNLWWCVREMQLVCKESKPDGWKAGDCRHSWAVGWCKRFSVTTQCGYNSKAQDILDRQHMVQLFHRFMSRLQASGETDQKYGRFGKRHVLHVDQVLYSFVGSIAASVVRVPCILKCVHNYITSLHIKHYT